MKARTPREELITRLYYFLKSNGAEGRGRAMTIPEIMARFRPDEVFAVTSVNIRRLVSEAPMYDLPVCSSSDGVFIATEEEDFNLCIAHLSSRIRAIKSRRDALESLRADFREHDEFMPAPYR